MSSPSTGHDSQLPRWLVLLLATAIGAIAANLYYAQPLVAVISRAVGLQPEAAGLVVTLTQIGYGAGVLTLVPLGDIVESRKLVATMVGVSALGLLGLAFAVKPLPYFAAAIATGLGTASVQALVPYASHFASDARRGQVIGTLSSGLMLGIMLSRPVASLLTDLFSWQAVFVLSAAVMAAISATLLLLLPPNRPSGSRLGYGGLLRSMAVLFATQPLLRQRAAYQALLFGTFCLFWTASPLLLAGPEFGFSQSRIALFALVGVSGVVVAPLAGRAADRGWVRPATAVAMTVSILALLITRLFPAGSTASLAALVAGAVLLDAGITANLVLGQRTIFELGAEVRSRLNALYIATIFVGGGAGSALGAYAFARGGWNAVSWVGIAMPTLALLLFAAGRCGREGGDALSGTESAWGRSVR